MIKYLSKVFYILTGKRKQLVLLLFVFILTSLLEALGIGLIGPFLTLVSEPEYIHKVPLLAWAYQKLSLQSNSQFILLLSLIIAGIFCIKAGFYVLAQIYIYRFSHRQKSLLRNKLLNFYLTVPYSFHLSRNTASIIKNIILETQKFYLQCLLPLLEGTANLIVILVLLFLLAKTDLLLLTMIMLSLLPTVLLFYRLRKRLVRWGKRMSQAEQEMIRVINHGLGGIKETRIIGCESYFEQQMQQECHTYEQAAALFNVTQRIPRIIIEAILILFLLFFISISQLFFEENLQNITSILGVFAVASMRLIPAVSNSINAINKMQNGSYALDMLYLDLKEIEVKEIDKDMKQPFLEIDEHIDQFFGLKISSKAMTFVNRVELNNITYRYSRNSEAAIENVSLSLKKGESIALLGKSGAGKTTLVDIILGLLEPESGDIKVDDVSIYQNLRSWQNLIGYIPQSIFLIDDTIEKNIAFGVPDNLIDLERLSKAIQAAQLEELIEELPDGIKTEVGERGVRLSGGQRQRIGIARALYHEREILVLDEATSALDNETESLVNEAIRSLAGTKTLIIIAHRLSTVEHCDRVYWLERGRVVKSGTYQEVVLAK